MSLYFTLGTTPKDELGVPTVGLRNVVTHPDLPTALQVGCDMLDLLESLGDYIEAYQQEGVVIRYE